MIRDLFSHKIHSSPNEWPDKLVELAALFAEFDGHLFDRQLIETRLQQISPRASYLAADIHRTPGDRLDLSKFRDEISAYPAYLGLYYVELSAQGWVLRLSATARRYLIREAPDVGAFLRLQLPIFQYPIAMGAAYRSGSRLRVQANVCARTLEFVSEGVHFSPVRLICVALRADAQLRSVDITEAEVSFDEIFALANTREINQQALPRLDAVLEALALVRRGVLRPPDRYERRFHILRHTEVFSVERGLVALRGAVDEADRNYLRRQVDAMCQIDTQFDAFDNCATCADVASVIGSAAWGRYFDGLAVLPETIVRALASDETMAPPVRDIAVAVRQSTLAPQTYPLRNRNTTPPPVRAYDRTRELADPELTRIRRQRRNLAHKELVDRMDAWLRDLGATPKETEHIDLVARIPNDGSFIFEMKSGGDSVSEQVRKAVAQLEEYRYRYRLLVEDPSLCLVLPGPPPEDWMTDYLCKDRGINVCWFESDSLIFPAQCADRMTVLARGPV